MFERLLKRAEYAKETAFPRESLYDVYGQVKMALELGAITEAEFMVLDTEIVKNGLNNPVYF